MLLFQFADVRSKNQRLGSQLTEREEELEEIKTKFVSIKNESRGTDKQRREVGSAEIVNSCVVVSVVGLQHSGLNHARSE